MYKLIFFNFIMWFFIFIIGVGCERITQSEYITQTFDVTTHNGGVAIPTVTTTVYFNNQIVMYNTDYIHDNAGDTIVCHRYQEGSAMIDYLNNLNDFNCKE